MIARRTGVLFNYQGTVKYIDGYFHVKAGCEEHIFKNPVAVGNWLTERLGWELKNAKEIEKAEKSAGRGRGGRPTSSTVYPTASMDESAKQAEMPPSNDQEETTEGQEREGS